MRSFSFAAIRSYPLSLRKGFAVIEKDQFFHTKESWTMRYKVTVENPEAYEEAAKLLRAGIVVLHRDEKRLYFCIMEPSTELIQKLQKLGAIVSVDTRFNPK